MAPEILKNRKYDHKVDVWSIGLVCYQLLFGFTAFDGKNYLDVGWNILAGDYRIPKNIKMTLEGLDFLNCCL